MQRKDFIKIYPKLQTSSFKTNQNFSRKHFKKSHNNIKHHKKTEHEGSQRSRPDVTLSEQDTFWITEKK